MNGYTVLVTGSAGMIGSRLMELLPEYGYRPIGLTRENCNLLDGRKTIDFFCENSTTRSMVINCAGFNGGINFNREYPADIYWQNSTIALNVLRASLFCKTKKVVSTITSCAYPDMGICGELEEFDLWKGEPNQTVSCHGFARRTLDAYSRQLFKQHGLMAINVVLNNCYGPRDRFQPDRSKFMAALIKKFSDAHREGRKDVVLWGTGKARREVLFSDDAARAIIHALNQYADPMVPLNMGTGVDNTIKRYAKLVAKEVGFGGNIIFDSTKPDGQMKKLLNVERMKLHTSFLPEMGLEEGIRRTVAWYNQNWETWIK